METMLHDLVWVRKLVSMNIIIKIVCCKIALVSFVHDKVVMSHLCLLPNNL